MSEGKLPQGVHFTLSPPKGTESIISTEAIEFLAVLHRTFDARRKELLENRKKVQEQLDAVGPFISLSVTGKILTDRANRFHSRKRRRRLGITWLGPVLPRPQVSRTGGRSPK